VFLAGVLRLFASGLRQPAPWFRTRNFPRIRADRRTQQSQRRTRRQPDQQNPDHAAQRLQRQCNIVSHEPARGRYGIVQSSEFLKHQHLVAHGQRNGDRWETVPEVDAQLRFLGASERLVPTAEKTFRDVQVTRLVGDRAAAGELRDVNGSGYRNFIGMFGLHPLFHTPRDNAEMTGPAVLEPVVRAFAATLREIVSKQPQ